MLGIYDVVANLGSLAARLVFSKVEEAAYLFFSQSLNRCERTGHKISVEDKLKEAEASRYLFHLLRGMTILGLTVCAFGFSYSHFLLHFYGGPLLSEGLGPNLLKGKNNIQTV